MKSLNTILPWIEIAIATTIVVGCHNTTLQIHENQSPLKFPAESKPDQTFKQGGYLVGLIDSFETPEVRCTEGKPQILIQRNFLDNVIHWTIGGIYTRRTVQVFCQK
ncbi:LA_3781 family PerA/PerB upregulated protein [Leptospira barantonii]|uniref:Lipoprotein n=1 Tax=Leptospira barantonii TaxID=2023184 RepID=A0ABX4NPP3_9LEPT|nr:hypothetical protein [Leptospira barantonii]PJZ58796.1 hypothetical protein CH367_01750 [Leptospira barantonii]